MSVRETLEADIIAFFKQIESQNTNDQRQTLRLLIDKYIHLTTSSMLMDKHDLEVIVSSAKTLMSQKTFPAYLGNNKRRVGEEEQATVCIIESTISHLNKNDCLKRLPKFDYREDSFTED